MNSSCNPLHFQRLARRGFLQVGALSCLGLSLGDYFRLQAAPAPTGTGPRKEPKAKNVIQIFLPGACSHLESWDPKPEASIDIRGPLGVVKTKIPGVVFGETLARTAQIVDKITVVRSVSGRIPDHGLATYHSMTGYLPSPAIQHPQMGAIVSHELGAINELPAWIGVPAKPGGSWAPNTGYMASRFGCFSVGGDPGMKGFQVRDIALPGTVSPSDFAKEQDLRTAAEAYFRGRETDGQALDTMDEFYRKAYGLLGSPAAQKAFRLDGESQATLDLYGCGKYATKSPPKRLGVGERLLFARRLVEAGSRFVSVTYEGGGTWDHHAKIKDMFSEAMPAFDHAFSGLITDLEQRGLLDSTLVMVMTEFGRTPKVNAVAGRDHHARNYSLVLAGGGITRGQVYGASDAIGYEPARDGVTLEDFLATAYGQLGIDSTKRIMAPGERPIDIVREGKVIKALIA
ncbi:MAG: hypothetical protein RLZZ244_2530 [Verrucomicrobiota bacterium]|jgi:hypothetical protein